MHAHTPAAVDFTRAIENTLGIYEMNDVLVASEDNERAHNVGNVGLYK